MVRKRHVHVSEMRQTWSPQSDTFSILCMDTLMLQYRCVAYIKLKSDGPSPPLLIGKLGKGIIYRLCLMIKTLRTPNGIIQDSKEVWKITNNPLNIPRLLWLVIQKMPRQSRVLGCPHRYIFRYKHLLIPKTYLLLKGEVWRTMTLICYLLSTITRLKSMTK